MRRAFLCGKDPLSGKSFEYRRMWIRQRLEFLASVFGIDCLTYTVLSNHLHLVLRSRPDVVAQWSDEKVARRWLRLFPQRQRVAKGRTRTGGRKGGGRSGATGWLGTGRPYHCHDARFHSVW